MKSPETYAHQLGWRLKYICKRLRIKREKLAPVVNVDPVRIHAMQRGEYTPDAEFIAKISQQYNLNPTWLITGHGGEFAESKEFTEIIQAVKKDAWLQKHVLDLVRHHGNRNTAKHQL